MALTESALGTLSEVGRLRTVMVHRPDLAHERLSPSNCHELLFDDVIWVRRARQEFDAFVDLMRDRGVEVLLFHDLLAETLTDPEARAWLLARRLRPEEVTVMFSDELTAWMSAMPAEELATGLTGGVTVMELPADIQRVISRAMRPTDFVIAPLPNQLFMRDTSAWIYGGVSINRMYWPARQPETLNLETVYRFHPRFRDEDFQIWFGGVDHDWGGASLEGGDVMPVGDGIVLVGQGERTNARAASILARNLFHAGAARVAASVFACSGICFSTSGVRTKPGQMTLVRTPIFAPSFAAARASPRRPCLAATYADFSGEASMLCTLPM